MTTSYRMHISKKKKWLFFKKTNEILQKYYLTNYEKNESNKFNVNKNNNLNCINKKEINQTGTLNTNKLHARF